MKQHYFIFLFASVLLFTSFTRTQKFPSFVYQTVKGDTLTNEIFKGKSSMVIMAHLGCPAAMLLFKDLETLKTDQLQILIILENIPQQVLDFNSTEKNLWSDVRNYFKLNPIEHTIIAECETQKIKQSGDDIRIETQCRKLSKKIKTKVSPTLVKVNENGEITTIIKGYFGDQEQSERIRKFMEMKLCFNN